MLIISYVKKSIVKVHIEQVSFKCANSNTPMNIRDIKGFQITFSNLTEYGINKLVAHPSYGRFGDSLIVNTINEVSALIEELTNNKE